MQFANQNRLMPTLMPEFPALVWWVVRRFRAQDFVQVNFIEPATLEKVAPAWAWFNALAWERTASGERGMGLVKRGFMLEEHEQA